MFRMTKVLPAVLALVGGAAMAQSSPVPAPVIFAPPSGTLSTTETRRSIDSAGTETESSRSTYRNTAGVADDVRTKTTTHPAPVTTTTRSSTTSTE